MRRTFATARCCVRTIPGRRGAVKQRSQFQTPAGDWAKRDAKTGRILNGSPPDAESWMALLRSVADNDAASDETKAEAKGFIEYQTEG